LFSKEDGGGEAYASQAYYADFGFYFFGGIFGACISLFL
jgi:hypothetical protein